MVDDNDAKFTGEWTKGTGLKGFIGEGYLYSAPGGKTEAAFSFKVPADGEYEIRYAWAPHENRAADAVCSVDDQTQKLDLRQPPSRKDGFHALGTFTLKAAQPHTVILSAGTGGHLHADAVWIVPSGK